MFPRETRPLKRPRLGVPDFYPQENKQREVRSRLFPTNTAHNPRKFENFFAQDELSYQTLNIGFRVSLPSMVDSHSEVSE